MKNNHKKQWTSRWAFIIATTGAAVGLGNIWRFPYMAGSHGGGAFVMIYLLAVIAVGIPLMLAEMVIGHYTQTNPIDAIKKIAMENGRTSRWAWVGVLGLISLALILSFYSVVGGFSLYYMVQSLTGTLAHATPESVHHIWQQLVGNPWKMIMYHSLFMLLTMSVIALGVINGLERATKIMMPALFLILIALAVYAAINGAFLKAVHFLFDFKWSVITPKIVVSALGHAFFTLALGAGALLMYASYSKRSIKLLPAVIPVAILDVLVAFLSGISIFPLVFAHGIAPQSGPDLMYIALPLSFSSMPFGRIVGFLFFILLLFSAWTSSINLAEPMIATLTQRKKISRKKAALWVGFSTWFLGLFSALSFNVFAKYTWHGATVFDLITGVTMDFMLPIGGLGFALFATWVMTDKQRRDYICKSVFCYRYWKVCTKIFSPIAIILIILSSIC